MTPALESRSEPQSAGAVLMVRPASFGFNPATFASNPFQQAADSGADFEPQRVALAEFDGVARELERRGIQVLRVPDTPVPAKPDAIFPNNWVSFHNDGSAVLYPMLAPNRRLERREEILEAVAGAGGFRLTRTIDLTHREAEGKFLEGTGSLVLDRVNHVAYASLSPRTDLDVLGEFAQVMDYDLVMFEAFDAEHRPVYHTNVVMAVGTRFAVICGEAILDARHRRALFDKLQADGHVTVDISGRQMLDFAGNVIELSSPGGPLIVVSATAWESLVQPQRRALEAHGTVILAAIPTIERIGGGSVRCMLAEVHLPRRTVS
ncbi:MAG TPA: arginine deiminase-related protein [Steroidobacteraceae bacterium]|jgi:hypothetical protein|nr:arginine deiminase-related protein [Steroidobacteraceae bacterium]